MSLYIGYIEASVTSLDLNHRVCPKAQGTNDHIKNKYNKYSNY